jgi:hypothetical protein
LPYKQKLELPRTNNLAYLPFVSDKRKSFTNLALGFIVVRLFILPRTERKNKLTLFLAG